MSSELLSTMACLYLGRPCLFGGDEGGTDIGKVRAHGLRGQHGVAGGNGTAQDQRAVKPLANFLNQRKRALQTGMAPCPCRHRDETVRTLLDRLVGMLVVDDVMQHHAAIGMGSSIDVLIERAKNRRVAETLGNAARIKRVNGFRGDVAGGAGTHGNPNEVKRCIVSESFKQRALI